MSLFLKKSSIDNKKVLQSKIGFKDVFAIDLGTSITKIYSKNKDSFFYQESILSIWKNTTKILAFGDNAKKLYNKLPQDYMSIFPIENGKISNQNIATLMLKCLLSQFSTKLTLSKSSAYFLLDNNFDDQYKEQVISILKKINIGKIYFIDAIESALIGMNIKPKENTPITVLKLSGGYSSINIVKKNQVICSKEISFTGEKINLAIINYLAHYENIQIAKFEAEKAKKDFLSALKDEKEIIFESYGKDLCTGYHKKFKFNNLKLFEATQSLFDTLLNEIIEFIKSQSDEVKDSLLDSGLFLTGGECLIKNLKSFLSNKLTIPITVSNTPDKDAIIGTQTILKKIKEMKYLCIAS